MRARHAVLLALGVLAVSFSAPLIRLADAPPLAVAFYRNAFAAALLLPLALSRHRSELRAVGGHGVAALAGAGVLLAVHFAAWIPSVTLTTVAASTVLVTTQPVWAAAGGRLLFGDRIGRAAVAGIVLALGGALLISGFDFVLSARAFAGDLLALLGAVTAAGYLLTGRRMRQQLSLAAYTGVVYAVCAVSLLLAAVWSGTPLSGFDPRVWVLFGLMALGPQILGHTVFNYLLRDLDATVIAVAVMGEPVGASALAFLFFGEVPPLSAVLGGGLVLAGIYVAITAQSRAVPAVPVE